MSRSYSGTQNRSHGASSRRRAVQEDSESPDEREEMETDTPMRDAGHESDSGGLDSATRESAKNLVRFALACEFQRIPIRKAAFKEKCMGDHKYVWKKTFDIAQKMLRGTFGMEMRPLPAKEKLTMEEIRKSVGTQSSSTNKPNENFILVSLLPAAFRTPTLVPPTQTPTAKSEAAHRALTTLLLTLIHVHSGEITDARLRRYLLRADPEMEGQKLADLLTKLERQGYIVKRSEKGTFDGGDDKNTTYLAGPRGKVEVGHEEMANFVRGVWTGRGEDTEKAISETFGVQPIGVEGEEADEEMGTQPEIQTQASQY